jgi:hypothetical protein
MSSRIKIRGIYSTALTKFALDSGFLVVEPSDKVRERFRTSFAGNGQHEILIRDRKDLQGIEIRGEADHLCELLTLMQQTFVDAVIVSFLPTDDAEPVVLADIELPGMSKQKLDGIRSGVLPTLKNHHRFKIMNPELLESAEAELARCPEHRIDLENRLLKQVIFDPLIKGGVVRLEHIRPSGRPMRPRVGTLHSVGENRIVFKRILSKGRYDGLDLPISEGDYCLTELREGEWSVKHSYFSKDRLRIGEYFNINTPTEFYSFGARYVDLEVDVIRRAGEKAFAIDEEKLDMLVRKGCIGKGLRENAVLTADRILRSLNRGKKNDSLECA